MSAEQLSPSGLCPSVSAGVIFDTQTDELQSAMVDAIMEQQRNPHHDFALEPAISVINTVNVYKISRLSEYLTYVTGGLKRVFSDTAEAAVDFSVSDFMAVIRIVAIDGYGDGYWSQHFFNSNESFKYFSPRISVRWLDLRLITIWNSQVKPIDVFRV